MAFWSKFIEVEEEAPKKEPLADLSDLEGLSAPAPVKEKPKPKAKGASTIEAVEPEPATPQAPARSALDWTLDEVYRAGKAELGRNSADTVLKLRDGLRQLPPEQQLAMVRVMDKADETWDENHVLADAKNRVAILTRYLDFVSKDEEVQVAKATASSTAVSQEKTDQVEALDTQIKELQRKREDLVKVIAQAQADAEEQAQGVRAKADKVRELVKVAVDRYKEILTFFGV
jgi:hypothetical protein